MTTQEQERGPAGGPRSVARAPLRTHSSFLNVIGMVGVAAMAVHTVVDVFRRQILNSADAGTIELVTNYYLIAIAFMGLYVAQQRKEHIEVTVFSDRLSANARTWLSIFGQLLTVVLVVAMAWYGWESALDNMREGEHSGVVNLPIWPSRFLVPLGFAAYACRLVIDLAEEFRQRGSVPEPAGFEGASL